MPKEPVIATFIKGNIKTEVSDAARELYNKSVFGAVLDDGSLQLALVEALYLMEKGKITIIDGRKKPVSEHKFVKRATRIEPSFWVRYCVYKSLRGRGYVVKTALKFGADFRVYDRGIRPGEDHAKWVVFPVPESQSLTWHEFSAKNRVAHSTKKRLLLAVVDDEGDVSYWESRWVRP